MRLGAQGILSFRPSQVPPPSGVGHRPGALPSPPCRLGREFRAGTWAPRSVLRFSRAALTLPEHSSSVAAFPEPAQVMRCAQLTFTQGPGPSQDSHIHCTGLCREPRKPPPELSLICRWWVSYEFPLPSSGPSIGDG